MTKNKFFKNRILGEGTESPDQLLANPKNWRIHPSHQRSALLKVLDTVGWVDQVIVNKTTGHLIDGHLRVSVAMEKNEQSVPVVYVELSEQEEEIILASLDPIGALAVADKDLLENLLESVRQNKTLTDLADTIASKYNLIELEQFGDLNMVDEEGLPSNALVEIVIRVTDVSMRPIVKDEIQNFLTAHKEWGAVVK